jgi:hypothetical protein
MAQGLFQGLTSSSSPHILIERDSGKGNISCITICNAHASNAATIQLYIAQASLHPSVSYSILENFVIPAGASFQITEGISFNDQEYSLLLAIAEASVDVNVIIK